MSAFAKCSGIGRVAATWRRLYPTAETQAWPCPRRDTCARYNAADSGRGQVWMAAPDGYVGECVYHIGDATSGKEGA